MSVSAIFGSRIAVAANTCAFSSSGGGGTKVATGGGLAVIECSSRPKKKATAHHMKTRPKKTQPWDVRRGPAVYPPLPPLPPDWTPVTDDVAEAVATPPPPQPLTTES